MSDSLPTNTAPDIADVDFGRFNPEAPVMPGRTATVTDPNQGNFSVRDAAPVVEAPKADNTMQELSSGLVDLPAMQVNTSYSIGDLFIAGINDGVSNKGMSPLNAAHRSMLAVLKAIEPFDAFANVEMMTSAETGATSYLKVPGPENVDGEKVEIEGGIDVDGITYLVDGAGCKTQPIVDANGFLWLAQTLSWRRNPERTPEGGDGPPLPSIFANRPMKLRVRYDKKAA